MASYHPPCAIPTATDIAPPKFPARPDLFDEVEWGPLPSDEDIHKAYKIWTLQDNCLSNFDTELGSSTPRKPDWSTCLGRNVYEELVKDSILPLSEDRHDAFAQFPNSPRESRYCGWTFADIFGEDDQSPVREPSPPTTTAIQIHGHDVLKGKYWTKAKLQPELRSRGLDANGLVAQLRERLYQDEVRNQKVAPDAQDVDKGSLLPRQDLSDWGIPRSEDDFMLKIKASSELSPHDMYTWAILLSPFNPAYWNSRAFLFYQMGHFDLAIGDAYRAQLLCEVLVNPLQRNAQPGLYIRIWDAIERHILQIPRLNGFLAPQVELLRKPNGINSFVPIIRKSIHSIISLSLLGMQCWEDYAATEPYLRTRLVMADRDEDIIRQREAKLRTFIRSAKHVKRNNHLEYFFERHYGSIMAREYPYDTKDIEHNKDEIFKRVNTDFLCKSQVSPQLHAGYSKTGRIGVFANESIPKGSTLYVDEPSIRGHLRLHSQPHGTTRCENCNREITSLVALPPVTDFIRKRSQCHCAKLSCPTISWCPKPLGVEDSSDSEEDASAAQLPASKRRKTSNGAVTVPSCMEIGKTLYHNRTCGKDWLWLHRAMRQESWESGRRVAKEMGYLSHSNEQHGTLLSLLLRDVFDITLLRRETDNKPNLLAHEIDELMPISPFGQVVDKQVPFSFAANVRVPFDILLSLGVNIFRDLTFDTWVIQSVFRKLLVSAIPWHSNILEPPNIPDPPELVDPRDKLISTVTPDIISTADPTFSDLYVFPVMSMLGHVCARKNNVEWYWDSLVPNRLILRTARDIAESEELTIRYTKMPFTTDNAKRTLGHECDCEDCTRRGRSPCLPVQRDIYGEDTSEASDNDAPQLLTKKKVSAAMVREPRISKRPVPVPSSSPPEGAATISGISGSKNSNDNERSNSSYQENEGSQHDDTEQNYQQRMAEAAAFNAGQHYVGAAKLALDALHYHQAGTQQQQAPVPEHRELQPIPAPEPQNGKPGSKGAFYEIQDRAQREKSSEDLG